MKTVNEIFIVKVEGFEDVAFRRRDEAKEYYNEMRGVYRNVSLVKRITTVEELVYNASCGVWL